MSRASGGRGLLPSADVRAAYIGIGLAACACAPSFAPPWVIERPREIAMHLELVAQGPWGEPIDPQGPTASEVLPGDTLRATPFIADVDGPIALDTIDAIWALCDIAGRCRMRSTGPRLPACDGTMLVPELPCDLGRGGTIDLTIGAPPVFAGQDLLEIATLIPTISLLASPPGGPGTDACMDRLIARESLDGCLWMERPIPIGPFSEVVGLLEALGYEAEVSESLQPLLERPRNHNPGPPRFSVVTADATHDVESGGEVTVRVGDDVAITYRPRPTDIEAFEVEIDDTVLEVVESLVGRWFADREVDGFEPAPPGLALAWHAARPETVRFYFLLRDDRGSEVAGWLAVAIVP